MLKMMKKANVMSIVVVMVILLTACSNDGVNNRSLADITEENKLSNTDKNITEKTNETNSSPKTDLIIDIGKENNNEQHVDNEFEFDNNTSQTNNNVSTTAETYDTIYNRIKDLSREEILQQKYKWDYEITLGSGNKSILDCLDHSFNKVIFGYDMPSKEVLYSTIDRNNNISDYYKQYLKTWIDNWLNKYPGSDFTIFNENLKTLEIKEASSREIQKVTHSVSTLACYVFLDNAILINQDADKNDTEFMRILDHEIAHSARIKQIKGDSWGEYYNFSWNNVDNSFLFLDESFVTLFTSMENEGGLYRFVCNCSKIIIEATNYTGTDYINHSPYELGAKIDYSLSDITSAKELITGMQNLGNWIYDPVEKAKLKVEDVHDTIKTIIKIYLKLHPEATYEEVYDTLTYQVDITISKYNQLLTDEILQNLYSTAKDEMKA